MRIYRGHALVRDYANRPHELAELVAKRHAPICTYLRQATPPALWPGKSSPNRLDLIVLPGEPDDVWPGGVV